MPIYTYECETCGERFDTKQSFADMPLTICPTCTGKIHRVIQPAGIVFKGSGFYVTDNRGKQNLATPGTKKDDARSSDGGTDSTGDKGGSGSSASGEGSTASGTESTSKTPAAATSSENAKSTSSSTAKS